MRKALLVGVVALAATLVACEPKAEEHTLGPQNGPNISVRIPEREHTFNRHFEVHRSHFHKFRHGRSEFGVVIETPWVPDPAYPYRRAWCSDPAGYYPDVRVCYQPWVRIID